MSKLRVRRLSFFEQDNFKTCTIEIDNRCFSSRDEGLTSSADLPKEIRLALLDWLEND